MVRWGLLLLKRQNTITAPVCMHWPVPASNGRPLDQFPFDRPGKGMPQKRSEPVDSGAVRILGYLGFTLELCVDTHCHRPSRITQTSVYRNVISARCPCLMPTTCSVNQTTAVSPYTLTVNSS